MEDHFNKNYNIHQKKSATLPHHKYILHIVFYRCALYINYEVK